MDPSRSDSPFEDLPEALVEEMLAQYKVLGAELSKSFEAMQANKTAARTALGKEGLLHDDAELIKSHVHPTTCGVDGSYVDDRLLYTDIAAMAGVAVEGLTPPSEKRIWPVPHHLCKVLTVSHNESTALIIRAIMITMELELATRAPHDVVFLDGSLTTPVIHFNQAFGRLAGAPSQLSAALLDRMNAALENYREILGARRSDKIYAGVPKYTSRNEVARRVGTADYEDRSMLSFALAGGEVVGPVDMIRQEEDWHFTNLPVDLKAKASEAISLLREVNVIYYKPSEYFPTIRVEMSPSIARNQSRLSILLESLRFQCGAPAIMEPYPLYLADRMVKHMSTALPAIRKATTQEMASSTPLDVGNIFLAMHGYRSDS